MVLELTDILVRLALAATAGAILGINRDMAQKPMGSRTLALVALGAATIALAAMRLPGIAQDIDATSRVVQGIIQGIMGGISFIGAGVILRDASKGHVSGLTTAATVWATAAIGVACAFAEWTLVIAATTVCVLVLTAPRILASLGFEPPRTPNAPSGPGVDNRKT